MQENNDKEFVAVMIEGQFTEWYSPNYKDPYEEDKDNITAEELVEAARERTMRFL